MVHLPDVGAGAGDRGCGVVRALLDTPGPEGTLLAYTGWQDEPPEDLDGLGEESRRSTSKSSRRTTRALPAAGAGHPGTVGEATAYLFDARELVEQAVGWIESNFSAGGSSGDH